MQNRKVNFGDFKKIDSMDLDIGIMINTRCDWLSDIKLWDTCKYLVTMYNEIPQDILLTGFYELISNAWKYSIPDTKISIKVYYQQPYFKFVVHNYCSIPQRDAFIKYLSELYLNTHGKDPITAHFLERDETRSGIGLMILLYNYPFRLGFSLADTDTTTAVTVQALFEYVKS